MRDAHLEARTWHGRLLLFVAACLLALAQTSPVAAQGTLEEIQFDRKLVASAATASDRFGAPIALDGDVLVVATPSATVDGKLFAGAAYVFARNPSGGWDEQRRLVAADGAAFDQLGGSAVAVDGDTVFLGASRAKVGDVLQQGAVYVFARNAGGADTWGQVAKLTDDSVGVIGNFGSSIAAQGDLLAVGASRAGGNGQVTLFERDPGDGAWGKVTAIPDNAVADGGSALESFGGAVALDGDLLLVGAGSADVSYFLEDDGAAYLFRRDATDRARWDFVTRLTAPEATICPGGLTLAEVSLQLPEVIEEVERCAHEEGKTDRDGFGGAVAIDGDTIVVGAAGAEDASGPVIGAVSVFQRDPAGSDRWELSARLAGSDVLASVLPGFGRALALDGDTLLVGASGVDVATGTDQGAAYRFVRDADRWVEAAKIVAGDGLARETFGAAVALDGDDAIVGASGYELGQGAVYLGGEPPPDVPPEPAFPPTGALVDDGVFAGPQGVLLGAVDSGLAEPLPVWIVEVPPPAEPLPAPMTAVGAFTNVGAAPTASTPSGLPFGLALPVPEGADTAHLAVAVLASTSHVLDGIGASWVPLQGRYNPETALLSVALPSLFLEGATVVLVEDPDLGPLPTAADRTDDVVPQFAITCRGFTDPSKCTPADQARMNRLLQAAHDDFVRLKIGKPELMTTSYTTTVTEDGVTFERVEGPFFSNVFAVEPGSSDCQTGILGKYDARFQRIFICYNGSATPEAELAASIRHEIFHAFQHGFRNFDAAWSQTSGLNATAVEDMQWIREGTAAAAEESAETMHRNKVQVPPLHAVNRALTASDYQPPPAEVADVIAYSAQDFWVYLGKKAGSTELGLNYLTELFSRGLSPDAVDRMLSEVHGTSLADQYWGWAKNQTIEKAVDFDLALPDPCNLEFPRDTPITGTPQLLFFPAPDGPRSVTGTLGRLTARVVMITMISDVGPTTVTAEPADPNLKYKVYVNKKSGCAGGNDGPRTLDPLERDSVVFVVLANTSHQAGSRIGFTLSLAPAP